MDRGHGRNRGRSGWQRFPPVAPLDVLLQVRGANVGVADRATHMTGGQRTFPTARGTGSPNKVRVDHPHMLVPEVSLVRTTADGTSNCTKLGRCILRTRCGNAFLARGGWGDPTWTRPRVLDLQGTGAEAERAVLACAPAYAGLSSDAGHWFPEAWRWRSPYPVRGEPGLQAFAPLDSPTASVA